MRSLHEWVPQTRSDKANLLVCGFAVIMALAGLALSFTPLLNKQVDTFLFRASMIGGIFIFPLGYCRLRFWED